MKKRTFIKTGLLGITAFLLPKKAYNLRFFWAGSPLALWNLKYANKCSRCPT